MQIPRLIMHSVQGKIGLTTTPASLKMEQPQADLEIEQPSAEMEISVTPGKLTIDQTQAWEELDRKHVQDDYISLQDQIVQHSCRQKNDQYHLKHCPCHLANQNLVLSQKNQAFQIHSARFQKCLQKLTLDLNSLSMTYYLIY